MIIMFPLVFQTIRSALFETYMFGEISSVLERAKVSQSTAHQEENNCSNLTICPLDFYLFPTNTKRVKCSLLKISSSE